MVRWRIQVMLLGAIQVTDVPRLSLTSEAQVCNLQVRQRSSSCLPV